MPDQISRTPQYKCKECGTTFVTTKIVIKCKPSNAVRGRAQARDLKIGLRNRFQHEWRG